MVVDYFDADGMPLAPLETDAPLVVDSNAVLAFSVARKPFQAIAGWRPQILYRICRVYY